VQSLTVKQIVFQCLFLIIYFLHKTENVKTEASLSLHRKLAHIPYKYSHKSEDIPFVHVKSGRDTEALWSGDEMQSLHFTCSSFRTIRTWNKPNGSTGKSFFLLYLL